MEENVAHQTSHTPRQEVNKEEIKQVEMPKELSKAIEPADLL